MIKRRRRRASVPAMAAAVAVAVGGLQPAVHLVSPLVRAPSAGGPDCRAERFKPLRLPGARITGVRTALTRGGQAQITPPSGTSVPGRVFCEVEIALTHGREGTRGLPADDVHVWVWLPKDWNGRLQAVGGGGTKATYGAPSMVAALQAGYAVTASDAGLSVQNPRSDIFLTDGEFNWQLFENWSYRSVHENAVLAKDVVRRHYGKPARFSYWNGCSNGGRQGVEMTQRFPDDFDGVLAAAPAIYGAERLNMTMSWPGFLQNDAFGGFIPTCKMEAMSKAVVRACDGADGVVDGLVGNPAACDYRRTLAGQVGRSLPCGKITAREAEVATRIFQGPRTAAGRFMWYGYTPGTDLTGATFGAYDGWPIRNFLKHDPAYDWRTSSTDELINVFGPMFRSRLDILSGSDPVLLPFANRGGKLLMWHGLADGAFPADQSVHYYKEVEQVSGERTADFFRLFLAPGVDHCGGGTGPVPTDPFGALVAWVERGIAPQTLPAARTDSAGAVVRERALCPYPQVQVYQGGDPDRPQSFRCGDSFPKAPGQGT
ncbi:tannase/feruloyl esterase family alpha/beta hydrolase [Actinomadura miaoliensis]|uniref:Tannase/feruloyl esterase family alpha/beta hydrolase n=1 Tax=Actinomadura miaoliensis TaxID=430685 RepID=A0ABP7VCU5_9ACTN